MAHSVTDIPPPTVVVHTRPVLDMDDRQFFALCQLNRDLRLERTADGDILIMPPTAGSTGRRNFRLAALFGAWEERDRSGQCFDSSTGFRLPNGATRSPDLAWVRQEGLDALSAEDWETFLPLCPDFVLELRSPSDALGMLQDKMAEYLANGARLGWLLDPVTKRVYIYRPGREVEAVEDAATLSGEPVLAGFLLDLGQIWLTPSP